MEHKVRERNVQYTSGLCVLYMHMYDKLINSVSNWIEWALEKHENPQGVTAQVSLAICD